jgi:hypothetical protein
MKKLSVQFTLEELQALLELVDNQLFRMKYIDSKVPGYKSDPEKLKCATAAVQSLKETFKAAKGFKSRVA